MPDELQAEQNRLALHLAMTCTLALARSGQMPADLATIAATELKRIARLTEADENQIQFAAQMNSLALHLGRG